MKKTILCLLCAITGYIAGTCAFEINAQSHIGGDAAAMLERFLVTRTGATVENSIQALNGNWRIDGDGTAYIKQIVLEPQPMGNLLPVDGALIFLENPVQLGMGYNGQWNFCELIPEEDWAEGMITDAAVYYSGRRWLARTDDLVIQ